MVTIEHCTGVDTEWWSALEGGDSAPSICVGRAGWVWWPVAHEEAAVGVVANTIVSLNTDVSVMTDTIGSHECDH